MIFLPIAERELRVRARQRETHRVRLAAALAGTASGLLFIFFSKAGSGMFQLLALFTWLFSLFIGARNTADCLSEEKRAGTLGLLFLTDLKGHDVVLGKLLATSLNSAYALLALVPALALPILVGGVTGGEVTRLVLVLGDSLFLSLSLGLLISALSRKEARAWTGALCVLVFLVIALPLVGLVPGLEASWLLAFSPTTAYRLAFEANYAARSGEFWRALAGVHLLAWGFLVAACLGLPRWWQDEPRWTLKLRGNSGEAQSRPTRVAKRRLPVPEENPLLWLARRQLAAPGFVWLLVVLTAGGFSIAWLLGEGAGSVAVGLFVLTQPIHLLIAGAAGVAASRVFGAARDSGALELLLTTPQPEGGIVQAQVQALRRVYFRPLWTLFGVEGALLLLHLIVWAANGSAPAESGFGVIIALIFIGATWLDVETAIQYGLWAGLKYPKPSQASTRTLLYVILLPLALAPFCFFIWPGLTLVKNVLILVHADERLRTQFKRTVLARFSGEPDER